MLSMLIASFDLLMVLGTETIVFSSLRIATIQNCLSISGYQYPALSEQLINLDFSHTLLGVPESIPFGFQFG